MKSNDIKAFIIKHYQYFIVGVLFIALVAVLITFSGHSRKSGRDNTDKAEEGESTVEVPDVPLEKDAYPEVSALAARYFNAMGEGDSATLLEICSRIDDTELIRIEKKSEYVDNYGALECYTKPGYDENSYIVFEYYEIKFKNIDTVVPGLTSLYVMTADDGGLYVYNDELEEGVSEYVKAIYAQDDVVELLHKVDGQYSEALESDPTLKSFMEALPTALDDAVSAELAARESSSTESGDGQGGASKAKVRETINVRQSPSTDADKLGKLMGGDTTTVLEDAGDGWSKIDYQGNEAYVKTEYLEFETPGEAQAVTSEDTGEAQENTENAQENTDAASRTDSSAQSDSASETVSGRVEAKEAVSIRKGASTDSEKLGSAYKGDKFELIGTEGEWSKIKYNGQTAYIKSEFVTKL